MSYEVVTEFPTWGARGGASRYPEAKQDLMAGKIVMFDQATSEVPLADVAANFRSFAQRSNVRISTRTVAGKLYIKLAETATKTKSH